MNSKILWIYLKKDFQQVFIIFELLYKFCIRVGANTKLKVKDIDNDGIITFNEKNQKNQIEN